MKRKIKLTDLRHLESSKEEMNHIKGGEAGLCGGGCGCTCYCTCIGSGNEGHESGMDKKTNNALNKSASNASGLMLDRLNFWDALCHGY